jgi:hypothetical protein
LFERAFTADVKLADDLGAGHRYDAACCAAKAARGDGVDAPADPAERVAFRGTSSWTPAGSRMSLTSGWLCVKQTSARGHATPGRPLICRRSRQEAKGIALMAAATCSAWEWSSMNC